MAPATLSHASSTQSEASSLPGTPTYSPTAQAMQSEASMLPSTSTYVPEGHSVQLAPEGPYDPVLHWPSTPTVHLQAAAMNATAVRVMWHSVTLPVFGCRITSGSREERFDECKTQSAERDAQ